MSGQQEPTRPRSRTNSNVGNSPAFIMPPMLRRLFTFCSAISLLLCVAVLVQWARSEWRYDEFSWSSRSRMGTTCEYRSVGLVSEAGQLAIHRQWYTQSQPGGPQDWSPPDGTTEHRHEWTAMPAHRGRYASLANNGFSYGTILRTDLTSRVLLVPHWCIFVLTAILPAIALREWIRHRRIKPGSCVVCGYDLRATPGRCPECGTEPAR
jgi:hypothetical protein